MSRERSKTETERAVRLAVQRLDTLISGIGRGEDELFHSAMRETEPFQKVSGYIAATGVLGSIAVVIGNFLGLDPWGGLSLSTDTAEAALLGALFSLPLVRLHNMKWSSEDRRQIPALSVIRADTSTADRPLLEGMTRAQLAAVAASEAVLRSVWELAVVQQAIAAAVVTCIGDEPWATGNAPQCEMLAAGIAALLFAVIKASTASAQFHGDPKQADVVHSAMQNCERYYTVVNTDQCSAGSMARAFKAVALIWFQQRRDAVSLAWWMNAAEVLYVSGAWRATGNLAAPAVILALSKWVDIIGLQEPRREP